MTSEAATDEHQELRTWLINQAEERGNAIVSVAPEDGIGGYCFTAGAWRKHGVPEAIVIGLPENMAPVLLDAYVDRAANGQRFEPGEVYLDFFEELPLTFEHVHPLYYPAFLGSAYLIYPDGDFPALQIIVPTPDGHWPWDAKAPEGFGRWQPVLTQSGLPESF